MSRGRSTKRSAPRARGAPTPTATCGARCTAASPARCGRATWTPRSPPSRPAPAAAAEPIPVLEDTLRYLHGQRAWLGNYAAWQDAGYPAGSGLIERAVAVVINWRMKGRGIRWRRTNASAVVALRVRELNAAWESDDPPLPLAA